MADSIIYFLRFIFFYFLYLVFIPSKVLGIRIAGKGAAENIIKSYIISHIVIINCVYLLGLLHIYYLPTLVLTLLLVILVYLKIAKKVSYRETFFRALKFVSLVSSGQYKLSVLLKKSLGRKKSDWKEHVKYVWQCVFPGHIAECLVILVSFGILIAREWPLVFNNYAYLTSDMYVHHDWINFLEQNKIFSSGIYPFGMHNMISAFHKLAFLNLNIVMRYWGMLNCVLMVLLLLFLAVRLFHGKAVAMLPIVIYCVTDFSKLNYGFRRIYTLPQECGMLFLLPFMYYLGRFLKSRRWKDGIWFVFCAAIMVSMHFYTAIFAVLLGISLCIAFFRNVIHKEMIRKLVVSVMLIAFIGITPFALALASGKQWQGSMNWAMGIMSSSAESTAGAAALVEEEQPPILQRIGSGIRDIFEIQIESMNSYWGYVFWICMGLFAVYYITILIHKKVEWKDQVYASIWIFLLMYIVMYSPEILGIPKIAEKERIGMFAGYMIPLMLAVPAEMLGRLFGGKIRWMGTVVNYGLVVLLFFVTYYFSLFPSQCYFYLEPSLAAKACVKANEDFKKGTWTVVSPVEETSIIRNKGYHYELWDFISSMEEYEPEMNLEIPTEYVLFVLEKKPIIHNEGKWNKIENNCAPVDIKDAEKPATKEALGISDSGVIKYYSVYENRRILEAKLYGYLEEYKKAFPDELEVYMEDDECIVYLLKQNTFILNNFAMDYGYNEKSEANYDE